MNQSLVECVPSSPFSRSKNSSTVNRSFALVRADVRLSVALAEVDREEEEEVVGEVAPLGSGCKEIFPVLVDDEPVWGVTTRLE